jgi:Fe-S cluster biogenesis protein NfuA
MSTRLEEARAVLSRLRPAAQADGGDFEVVGVDSRGVVSVRFKGTCLACPSQELTLRHGIEKPLKQILSWVSAVVRVL